MSALVKSIFLTSTQNGIKNVTIQTVFISRNCKSRQKYFFKYLTSLSYLCCLCKKIVSYAQKLSFLPKNSQRNEGLVHGPLKSKSSLSLTSVSCFIRC